METDFGNGMAWRRLLTSDQLRIILRKGTGPAESGRRRNDDGAGIYLCARCGNAVFGSRERFIARTSTPIFWAPLFPERIRTQTDVIDLIIRGQVSCGRCGAHLGAVFEDGRPPSGLRYFVKAAAVAFVGRPAPESKKPLPARKAG
jgi:peptide-methionine (R)-S-oxide reductase